MHILIDLFPIAFFFITYKFAGIYWATAVLILSSTIQLFIYRIQKGRFERNKVLLFLAILLFGGLTLFFHNPAFIKWKVTIVCTLFSLAFLLSPHVGQKHHLIKKLLTASGENFDKVPEKKWQFINQLWVFSYLIQAGANHYFAFYQPLQTWVNFKVWGLTGINLAMIILSMVFIAPYIDENNNTIKDKNETDSSDEQS